MTVLASGSRRVVSGAVQVFNAIRTTVGAVTADFDFRAPWPEGRAATCVVISTATNATRTGVAQFQAQTTYNRAIGGALFAAAGVTIANNNNGLAVGAYTLDIAGNGARFRVTGVAGQTITWKITIMMYNIV